MEHLSVMSLEGSRQAYLAALGIPIWTVRADVPLSAQSVPLQFVAHQSDEVHIEAEPSVALKQTPKPVLQIPQSPPSKRILLMSHRFLMNRR
ncbi:MAG: hypothetical protein IPM78_11030 [Moraxellaceae bacterium]|nr:hypothetical protein [Moraxellaceae bacterium]